MPGFAAWALPLVYCRLTPMDRGATVGATEYLACKLAAVKMSQHRWSVLRLPIVGVVLAVPLVGALADDASLVLSRIMQDDANRQAVIDIAREQNEHLPRWLTRSDFSEIARLV
jgi:hypothetical protein